MCRSYSGWLAMATRAAAATAMVGIDRLPARPREEMQEGSPASFEGDECASSFRKSFMARSCSVVFKERVGSQRSLVI